ncbi:MAG: amino acid ABC transporter substrate-binding protein [Bacilli bacterium]|nr:amino acid ABC transporter substrate-binding protein [Bacilli bacterium]
MKYIKVIITTLVIICMIFLTSGCGKNENELVLVTEAGFAPYEYYEEGKIVGVDIDIANEIAKELGKELVIKDVSFDFVINEVKSGKADFAAAGISITPERAEEVDFTMEYTVSNQVVVVKKGSNIKNFDDIKDKKIAVQLGTVADLYASENYKDATIVSHKKYLSAVEDVKTGKADLIIMDELPAKEIVKENDNLVILDGVLFQDKYGMIVKKGNDELKEEINKVLERMINDGTIDKLVIKHSK